MAKIRGCGTRVMGGVYLVSNLVGMGGTYGTSLKKLLVDPPIPIDMKKMGLSAIGVKTILHKGVAHVWDVVGANNYPYPTDFIEEVGRLGFSRRIPTTFDLSALTDKSMLMLVHTKAGIANFAEYYAALDPAAHTVDSCPCGNSAHQAEGANCIRLLWQDIATEDVETDLAGQSYYGATAIERTRPGFKYVCGERPFTVTPTYTPALFIRTIIQKVEIVKTGDIRVDMDLKARMTDQSVLPVTLEDN